MGDSSSSFRAYRQALSESTPPCIPYVGLVLQDLTFVHIGNSDNFDGKVNFAKRWQQFNILDNLRRFKKETYPLKRKDEIVNFFANFENYRTEDQMWTKSEKIKPRGKKVQMTQEISPRKPILVKTMSLCKIHKHWCYIVKCVIVQCD